MGNLPLKVRGHSGWIFSKSEDFLVFVGLGLVILYISHLSHTAELKIESLFIWYIFAEYFLSSGHAFGSFYPVVHAVKQKKMSVFVPVFVVIGTVFFSFIFFNISYTAFITFLAISLLFHYIRQMIGWMHLSGRKVKSKSQFLDDFVMYSICVLPFMWYLADSRSFDKTLYRAGDLNVFKIPTICAPYILGLFFVIIAVYLLYQVKVILRDQSINYAKFVILLSALVCFYLPYVVFPEHALFWAPNAVVHAFSYNYFTYKYLKKKAVVSESSYFNYPITSLVNYFVFILVIGFLWSELFNIAPYNTNLGGIILPVAWSISLLHFITDAFIWKKRYML